MIVSTQTNHNHPLSVLPEHVRSQNIFCRLEIKDLITFSRVSRSSLELVCVSLKTFVENMELLATHLKSRSSKSQYAESGLENIQMYLKGCAAEDLSSMARNLTKYAHITTTLKTALASSNVIVDSEKFPLSLKNLIEDNTMEKTCARLIQSVEGILDQRDFSFAQKLSIIKDTSKKLADLGNSKAIIDLWKDEEMVSEITDHPNDLCKVLDDKKKYCEVKAETFYEITMIEFNRRDITHSVLNKLINNLLLFFNPNKRQLGFYEEVQLYSSKTKSTPEAVINSYIVALGNLRADPKRDKLIEILKNFYFEKEVGSKGSWDNKILDLKVSIFEALLKFSFTWHLKDNSTDVSSPEVEKYFSLVSMLQSAFSKLLKK